VRGVGRDEDERLHDEDDDSDLDDLEDAFVDENADAQADFAVGATFAANFGHDGIDPLIHSLSTMSVIANYIFPIKLFSGINFLFCNP